MSAEDVRMADALSRREEIPEWCAGSVKAVVRLADLLGLEPPEAVIECPQAAIHLLEDGFRNTVFSDLNDEDFFWLAAHLMAYVAQYLKVNHGGDWDVDVDPESPSYTKYVVNGFPSSNKVIDVQKIVKRFMETPAPRSFFNGLTDLIERVSPEF